MNKLINEAKLDEVKLTQEFIAKETLEAHLIEDPNMRYATLAAIARVVGHLEHREWFIKTISMGGL